MKKVARWCLLIEFLDLPILYDFFMTNCFRIPISLKKQFLIFSTLCAIPSLALIIPGLEMSWEILLRLYVWTKTNEGIMYFLALVSHYECIMLTQSCTAHDQRGRMRQMQTLTFFLGNAWLHPHQTKSS